VSVSPELIRKVPLPASEPIVLLTTIIAVPLTVRALPVGTAPSIRGAKVPEPL
jgi:hypothetical protein